MKKLLPIATAYDCTHCRNTVCSDDLFCCTGDMVDDYEGDFPESCPLDDVDHSNYILQIRAIVVQEISIISSRIDAYQEMPDKGVKEESNTIHAKVATLFPIAKSIGMGYGWAIDWRRDCKCEDTERTPCK